MPCSPLRRVVYRSCVAASVIVACMGASARDALAQASQTDVIRGRVTGPDSLPVEGVHIKATSNQGLVAKTTTTDKNGRFTIIYINGEGDYWLDFTRLGFAPKRFELKKIGDEEVMIANARMTSTIATLDAVDVVANRDRQLPNRNAPDADVSGGDRPLTNALVAPDQAGNLAAMAATIPGIQLIPGLDGAADMFSVLGLTGDQNNTTFNALGSGISALPPDILATTSIRPYSFDPASGGFSGAQISILTIPGSNFSRRQMSNVDITPPLEWADETADAQGQKYTNMRVGGNAAGPIVMDKAFYNSAYNVGRRFSDVQSLLNTNAVGLASAGVAADSVTRLLSILQNQHIPLSVADLPTIQAQDVVQATTNVDFMPSASGTGNSFTLGLGGNYQRSQPAAGRGNLLLTTPGHNGEADFWGFNTALVHTNYFWFGILEKTTFGFAESGNSTEPYLALPQGNVLVNSAFADGSSAVKSLSFGGSPVQTAVRNETVQVSNQLSWYSDDNRHTLKLTSSLAHDAFTNAVGTNTLGTFSFNSLADLAAAQPSSFSRTLSANTQAGSQLTGALALGDYWRPSANVQVQYGLRVDDNRFLSAPAFNRTVLDTFGLRNDFVPNRAYVSPRLGVQWYYGTAPQVSYAPGSARPPRAVVHAGVGIFQNTASAQLISSAVNSTGLANSTQTITCVGDAVPFPDWSSFLNNDSAIPTRCADGSAGTVFSSTAPSVTLFDPHYRQPHSLRGATDWSSPILDNRFVLGVQAIASAGLNQPGSVDVNFDPTAHFTLANEGGRPVFADPGAIVPGTGAIATNATRISSAFQRVTVQRSDLQVQSRQITVDFKPVTADARLKWDLTYAFLDTRQSYDGFTSTVGNPLDKYWGPQLQGGRHTIQLAWSDFPIFDIAYVSFNVRLTSGQQYTPMIFGDVNGDGLSNDRAFIFNPAITADTSVATAMRSLLAHGSASARACLQVQLNQLAALGSCQAPWTAQTGMLVKFNAEKIGLPKRLSVILNVVNPLGLADLALHGSNGLRGWGQNIPADQTLLYVRGFDPVAQQFKYEVNQRFGSTSPQQSTAHLLPYVSLSLGLDIGSPRERQQLTQRLDMGRGRPGAKQLAASMKTLGTSAIPNPMAMILQQQDSLLS